MTASRSLLLLLFIALLPIFWGCVQPPKAVVPNVQVPPTITISEQARTFREFYMVSPTPYGSPQSTINCEFLRQFREKQLLVSVQDHQNIESAITSLYLLPEDRVRIGDTNREQDPTRYYEWFTNAPYFGMLYHTAFGGEDALMDVYALSLAENPPSFALQAVFDCLGTPASYGRFLMFIDDGSVLDRFAEPVTSLTLYYPAEKIFLLLARIRGNDRLGPETRAYLWGIQVFHPDAEPAVIEERLEESDGPLTPWASEN